MGIHGLWKLLEPYGRNVSIQTLSGKKLAIDISIWLLQIEQSISREDQTPTNDDYVKCILFRLCKLMYYHIKPLIVFDEVTPGMKRKTLEARRKRYKENQKSREEAEIRKMATTILNELNSVFLLLFSVILRRMKKIMKNTIQTK